MTPFKHKVKDIKTIFKNTFQQKGNQIRESIRENKNRKMLQCTTGKPRFVQTRQSCLCGLTTLHPVICVSVILSPIPFTNMHLHKMHASVNSKRINEDSRRVGGTSQAHLLFYSSSVYNSPC